MESNQKETGDILIVKGDDIIARVGRNPVVIGRDQLEPYVKEELKLSTISREHIKITQKEGRLYIEDFKPSKNGTWLVRDGKAIEITSKGQEVELLLSDEIILAKNVTLKLKKE
ncbi:MAG: FHA domain-containing protein [Thermoplasmataceae archaeon]